MMAPLLPATPSALGGVFPAAQGHKLGNELQRGFETAWGHFVDAMNPGDTSEKTKGVQAPSRSMEGTSSNDFWTEEEWSSFGSEYEPIVRQVQEELNSDYQPVYPMLLDAHNRDDYRKAKSKRQSVQELLEAESEPLSIKNLQREMDHFTHKQLEALQKLMNADLFRIRLRRRRSTPDASPSTEMRDSAREKELALKTKLFRQYDMYQRVKRERTLSRPIDGDARRYRFELDAYLKDVTSLLKRALLDRDSPLLSKHEQALLAKETEKLQEELLWTQQAIGATHRNPAVQLHKPKEFYLFEDLEQEARIAAPQASKSLEHVISELRDNGRLIETFGEDFDNLDRQVLSSKEVRELWAGGFIGPNRIIDALDNETGKRMYYPLPASWWSKNWHRFKHHKSLADALDGPKVN